MLLMETYSSKLLVLLYLGTYILVSARAETNETESTTTTEKPEASPPEAESALVETSVNLEGQETRTKSASHGYSAGGKDYLSQETIYRGYPLEEQVYEYGKRIAGPYKASVSGAYKQDHIHYPQPEYIDSQGHYEQQQIYDYGHDIGKGIAYPQVKSHDDSYGKDDYGHSSDKGIDYTQLKIQSGSYGKKLDDYGHSVGKGTPYQQSDSYGKEHLDDYGHSSGKESSYQQEDSYGKEDYDKHDKSYSSYKSVGDDKAPFLKYSFEVPKKQYVSDDHYDGKSFGGSEGYGSQDAGYNGKSHDEGSFGKGESNGYSHASKSSDYSSGGHDYGSFGKVSHSPVIPKESGYSTDGHKEAEYLHQFPKGSAYQHEGGYHSDSGSSVGIPHPEVQQEKVAVFIKQIGHSNYGYGHGTKHGGERHGFLLLPVVPGKPDDKIKIETTGGYGGLDYKSIAQDYAQKPVHENDGKYSYSSYFKSGAANYAAGSGKSYDGNSKSAYGGHSKYSIAPHGGHSKSEISAYGRESKLHHDDKGHYNHGGHGGPVAEAGYGLSQAAKGHSSYAHHYGNIKDSSYGQAPIAQYHKEPLIYEGVKSSADHVSGYGINGNAKYANAQEYDHQKSYGKGSIASSEVAIPYKGSPYGKEGQSIDTHSSYPSGHSYSKGSYDASSVAKASPVSYGKQISIVPIKEKGGYSQTHGYENQKAYEAKVVSPYVVSSGERHAEIQGKGFPPASYGSFTPMIGQYGGVVDFSRSASQKSVSSKSHGSGYKSGGIQDGYGHSKQRTSSYRRPKSFAVILQRPQGGHSDGYRSSSHRANTKGGRGGKNSSHGYSEQGFQPIIPKHGSIGSIADYYNLHSYGSSPRYSAVPPPKRSSRKY